MQASTAVLASLAGGGIISACSTRKERVPPELGPSHVFYCKEAPEITEPGPLILPDGTGRCGWMRNPLLDLNLEDARFFSVPRLQRYRLKKWEMYYVVAPEHYLTFLLAWIGYGAFCEVAVYDRVERTWLSAMHLRPPRPEFPMMRNPTGGVTHYDGKKVDAKFEVEGDKRLLTVKDPGFAGRGFECGIELSCPAKHESICGSHLMHPRRPYFGQKITCMKTGGWWKLGDEKRTLDPEICLSILDFGRGYYPPKKFWYWSIASGRDADGALVGWNLGHGNNPEETIENCVFCNGRIHKMTTPIEVRIDYEDLYKPWRIWTRDKRCNLALTPENVRYSDLNLGFLYTHGRPALGLYNGYLTLDSGRKVAVKDFFGVFEWVDQRW